MDFNISPVARNVGVGNFRDIVFVDFRDCRRPLKGCYSSGNCAACTYADGRHNGSVECLNVDFRVPIKKRIIFGSDIGISNFGVDNFLIAFLANVSVSNRAAECYSTVF